MTGVILGNEEKILDFKSTFSVCFSELSKNNEVVFLNEIIGSGKSTLLTENDPKNSRSIVIQRKFVSKILFEPSTHRLMAGRV